MNTEGNISALYQTAVTEAADRVSLMIAGVDATKGELMTAIGAAIVARCMADERETAKTASSWARAGIDKNAKAWASASSYSSAMVWRLDSASLAYCRALVTPEAREDAETFAAVVASAVAFLGDYWKAYKGRDKAEPKAKEEEQPAQEAGASNAPAVDPALAALTETLDYIAALAKAGDVETLETLASAIADALAPATVQEKVAA